MLKFFIFYTVAYFFNLIMQLAASIHCRFLLCYEYNNAFSMESTQMLIVAAIFILHCRAALTLSLGWRNTSLLATNFIHLLFL